MFGDRLEPGLGVIPLATGALTGSGILLVQAVGAVLMSLSTIIVAINAQFLRKPVLS